MLKSSFLSLFFVMSISQASFAAENCLHSALKIAYDYVVPGAFIFDISPAKTSDPSLKKFVVTLANQGNPSVQGHVVIVVNARTCAEVMSLPSF